MLNIFIIFIYEQLTGYAKIFQWKKYSNIYNLERLEQRDIDKICHLHRLLLKFNEIIVNNIFLAEKRSRRIFRAKLVWSRNIYRSNWWFSLKDNQTKMVSNCLKEKTYKYLEQNVGWLCLT